LTAPESLRGVSHLRVVVDIRSFKYRLIWQACCRGIFRRAMASREDPDPYVVLGVRRQASPEEIVRAYRRAARLTHPDGGRSGAGSERFRAVSDAYEVLRDSGRRAGYDRQHPLSRSEAGRTARYAGPGSQHIVLGSRPSSATGRRGPSVANDDDLRVRSPIDEELLAVIRSLLLDRS
jgi:DnaJ-class molecular chaperone